MTRRASRTLIGVLSVTTVVGLSAYAIAHRKPADKSSKQVVTAPAGKGVTLMAVDEGTTTTPVAKTTLAPTTKPASTNGIAPALAKSEPLIKTTTPDAASAAAEEKPAAKAAERKATLAMATTDAPKAPAAGTVAAGKAKIESGDLLGGRKILNDALVAGTLSAADADAAKRLIAEANKTVVFSTRSFADDPWGGTHTVAPGELLQKIAFKNAVTSDLLLRINGIADARRLRAGATIKVIQGPFHCVVTKHAFTMDLYLGSPGEKGAQYVMTYPVGLGRDDSTPTGSWIVEQRIPNPKYYSPRGEGVIEAGDPKNPLGKYWIALTGTDGNAVGKQSYGIHGTIEPDSIGKQSSMGCIRMRNEDVAIVYEMLVSGKSTVVVKD